MLNYLKERFAEYALIAKKDKEPKTKSIRKQEDSYVDFEILYQGTDVVLDSFSMTKKEITQDFKYALLRNLSEILEVNVGNIRVLSLDKDITVCEITYSGKSHEYIKHEVKRITSRPDEAHLIDEDIYNNLAEIVADKENDKTKYPKIFNPYQDGSWCDAEWFCVRCGFALTPVPHTHTTWGEFAWEMMINHKTQWYLCANKECFHYDAPLILHHPIKGWTKNAEEGSYSISWVN